MKRSKLRYSRQEDIPQIKRLMQSVFGDSELFLHKFFTLLYHDNVLLQEVNGEVISMAFLLPNAIKRKGKISPVTYIYACATAPGYRGKGFMKEILDKAFADACAKGDMGIMLLPASDSLYDYYGKLGFKEFFYLNQYHFNYTKIIDNQSDIFFNIEKTDAESYYRMREVLLPENGSVIVPLNYFKLMEEPESNLTGFYRLSHRNEIIAICYLYKQDDTLFVKELLTGKDIIQQLPPAFYHYFGTCNLQIQTPGSETRYGQIRLNPDFSFSENEKGYFNFALE